MGFERIPLIEGRRQKGAGAARFQVVTVEWRGARYRAYFEGRTERYAHRDVGLRKRECHG